MNLNLNLRDIVQSLLVAAVLSLVGSGVGKIDRIADTVSDLNIKMARVLEGRDHQARRDADQDKRLDIQRRHIDEISESVSELQVKLHMRKSGLSVSNNEGEQ